MSNDAIIRAVAVVAAVALLAAPYRQQIVERLAAATDAPLWLPPLPGVVGDRGRLDGPVTTARITALFLDHTLRGEGTAAGLRTDLARFGRLKR